MLSISDIREFEVKLKDYFDVVGKWPVVLTVNGKKQIDVYRADKTLLRLLYDHCPITSLEIDGSPAINWVIRELDAYVEGVDRAMNGWRKRLNKIKGIKVVHKEGEVPRDHHSVYIEFANSRTHNRAPPYLLSLSEPFQLRAATAGVASEVFIIAPAGSTKVEDMLPTIKEAETLQHEIPWIHVIKLTPTTTFLHDKWWLRITELGNIL
jgi:hypothetical protein